jgi:hypothetical protein
VSQILHAIYDVSLHVLEVTVWCGVSECKITQQMFFKETINSYHYIQLILTPFFTELTQEHKEVSLLHAELSHGPHSTLLNRYWANCGFPDLYILIHYITPNSNIIICGGH